jgi:hypothetical protein
MQASFLAPWLIFIIIITSLSPTMAHPSLFWIDHCHCSTLQSFIGENSIRARPGAGPMRVQIAKERTLAFCGTVFFFPKISKVCW